jgi:peptidoglycan hydrolase CwlO-like protein
MRDVPIEDPNQKALLNQMIITSHLVREMAEKDAYLNSLKEQRAEALAEIERLKQQISEIGR